jgi:NifB/MoaA-like Fe-S oxidoreductase
MEREHVVMLPGQDLVADLDDQSMHGGIQTAAGMIDGRSGLLQDGIRFNHFSRHEIVTDTEMPKGALCLRAPELVARYFDRAETILFDALGVHGLL